MNTDEQIEDILEHHGVKGMHWGIRNAPKTVADLTRRQKRADKNWVQELGKFKNQIAIHNSVSDKLNNGEIDKFNAKWKHTQHLRSFNGDPNNWNSATKQYTKAYEALYVKMVNEEVKNKYGVSPSGVFKASFENTPNGPAIVVKEANAQHATNLNSFEMIFLQEITSGSTFSSVKPISNNMGQSSLVEDILEHHGVKGMHWGIRNKSRSSSKPSSDFKKTAPLRGKPVHSLTNKQLKDLNERMNLEQNFNRLNPSQLKKGHAFAISTMGTVGLAVTAFNLFHSPAGKALRNLGKKATNKQLKLF